MIDWYWLLVILGVVSYFFGNINFALIISKTKKQDIRSSGSGNPGTLNMSRTFGFMTGVLTFLLDMLKGVIPTLTAYFVFKDTFVGADALFSVSDLAIYVCGLCVVLGHIFPVVLKFKGGKGIASTIGVFVATGATAGFPWFLFIIMSIIAAFIFIYITEFGAAGSFIAITPPAIADAIRLHIQYGTIKNLGLYEVFAALLILTICILTLFAHRKNIERMLAGDEHPTSVKEMLVKFKAKREQKRLNKKSVPSGEDAVVEKEDTAQNKEKTD